MKKSLILLVWLTALPLMAAEPDPLKALHTACPGLAVHSQSLTIEKPLQQRASRTDQRQRGWDSVYLVKVRVSDQPSQRLAADFKAMGQHCYFEVESSRAQMLSISKWPCQAICRDKKYPPGSTAYFGVNGSEELIDREFGK